MISQEVNMWLRIGEKVFSLIYTFGPFIFTDSHSSKSPVFKFENIVIQFLILFYFSYHWSIILFNRKIKNKRT